MTELLWAGEFGRYQWIQYVLLILPAFTGGIHMLSQVMVGATPKHTCLALLNDTISEYVDSCHYISGETNETVSCQAWDYDRHDHNTTIVTDWNLVCDRRWMGSVAQAIYMFGSLVAGAVLGQMADRYGRWKILVPTGILQFVLAVACGFVTNYPLYIVMRFLIAINTAGSYMIGFVLALEMAPDRHRTLAGFFFAVVFAAGIAVVAGWSYLIRDWSLLQIVYGLHSSILLIHWWLVDESPRWLFAQGKYKEAGAIVSKQLKMNGKENLIPADGFTKEQLQTSLSNSESLEPVDEGSKKNEAKYGIVDLFRTPRLRWRTLNIALNWFANSLVYYGLSLNTGALVGDPHLMLFISGIIEIPAYFISFGLIDRMGRRPVISFCLFAGGLVCISTTYFPQTSYAWTTSTTTVVMFGKAFISISFAIIYNYTAELFPTVVRSSAMGIGTTAARTSGTLTPLIFLLDSLDPKLPSVLFGVVALAAGFFSLYLPETRDSPLLNTLQEGEEFGKGDTSFSGLARALQGRRHERTSSQQDIVTGSVISVNPDVTPHPRLGPKGSSIFRKWDSRNHSKNDNNKA